MTHPDDRSRRRHGALRDEILGVLVHAQEPLTARRVVDLLGERDGSAPALTTVLTVLDRLRRSGEVEKSKVDGELRFCIARHDAATVADDMLEALLRSNDRTGALLSFAGSLSPEDLSVLQGLVGDKPRRGESTR
jgi:Fe2+ or Zn2+ uptake regulation protein